MHIFARTLIFPLLITLLSATPKLTENQDHLTISVGEVEVLRYHKAEQKAPENAGEIFDRSAFIGPLRNSRGQIVTDTHPPNHWHHMGLWHPWTQSVIEGRPTDFWNLAKGEGTVRFVKVDRLLPEPKGGGTGFIVRQDHIILKPEEKIAIEESLEVIVRDSAEPFIIDYKWTQTPKLTIELPAYRYGGGLGYRGLRSWTKDKVTVLTSEGNTREDGNATRARWVRYTGKDGSDQDTSVVLMNAPTNHDFPQRLRIHPDEPFFNYVPQQEHDWKLEKDKPLTMSYRILIFAGKPEPEEIESQWKSFAVTTKNPPSSEATSHESPTNRIHESG